MISISIRLFPARAPLGILLTGQEAVELHEQLEVDIVALWGLSVRGPNVMSVEIDT